MKCTINDINLSFDKDNRLRKTILRISKADSNKATIIASFFNDINFKKFLLENITNDDILKEETVLLSAFSNKDYAKLKQNKLGNLLNEYYKNTFLSVDNSKTAKGMGRLNGFTSASAKTVAKIYNASLIITEYNKELNKPKEKRHKPLQIIADVNNEIFVTFYKRCDDFANYIINKDDASKEAKELAKQYIEEANKIIEINEQLDEDNNILESLLRRIEETENLISDINKRGKEAIKNKDKKSYLNAVNEKNNAKNSLNQIKEEFKQIEESKNKTKKAGAIISRNKYAIAQNIIALHSNNYEDKQRIRLQNYANLVTQTRANADAWYFEVFNTKRMTSIIKEFNNIGDIEEFIEEEDNNNDSIDNKYNNQTVDETSKSWEDNIYKSFTQTINGKLKMILSTIPKLSDKYNPNDNVQALDTNNELGVNTYMDSQFLTVQIYSFGDFSDVDSMIESLDNKSQSIKAIYGLGYLVNIMKNHRDVANLVFANFAKPIVNKTMLTISDISDENGMKFDYSNPNAFSLTELVFKMSNKLRATYNNNYDGNDINILSDITKKFIKDNNKIEFKNNLFDIVSKYFPNFDKEIFNNYFDNIKQKDIKQSTNILIGHLISIIRGIESLKKNINAETLRLKKEYEAKKDKYKLDIAEYNSLKVSERKGIERPEYPKPEYIDYADYDLNKTIYSGIIGFAKQIINYTESRARLNSTNSEGNSTSNVLKNCYVTRFFDQIHAESKEDSNAGLKNFLKYIVQGTSKTEYNQYSNNPILFGVKDENGIVIAPGMFTRTSTGYAINEHAKDFLNYSLFDGDKNTQTGNGIGFASMSKMDFLLTQYIAFRDSVKEMTEQGKTKYFGGLNSAVYPMRIGSDAPKIYFIRAPRYNKRQIGYCFYNHLMDELNMFCKGLTHIFQQEGNTVINGQMVPIFKTRKDINGLIGRAFFNEKIADEIKYNKGNDFTKAIVDKGRLTGNLFKFNRLFKVNGYNAGNEIENILSLYGGSNTAGILTTDNDGRLRLNDNNTIVWDGSKFVLNLTQEQKNAIKNIIRNWMQNFLIDCKSRTFAFEKILKDNNIPYSLDTLNDFFLNTANMNMCYDDFFEGDYKYYNGARDFLKRTKETQTGGDGYAGYSLLEDLTQRIHTLKWNEKDDIIQIDSTTQFDENGNPLKENVIIDGNPIIARNGWKGVTIYNTNKASDYAAKIQEDFERKYKQEGMSDELAYKMSVTIAKGYGFNAAEIKGDTTKINDAQSYITIEEFIRRKYADGTIQDYADLIRQLTDDTPIEQINLEEINTRIQVQKNFYFDKIFDKDTGLFIPRQIKNAEFVLIPKLLPKDSELRKVYEFMKKNDIGQLNTAETSKAAKKSIFSIWDAKTRVFNENFEEEFNSDYIEEYKYQYFYKQQDVPQHIVDANNKAGSQVIKKIIDNIINETDNNSPKRKQLKQWATEYQNAYIANIREDFFAFLDSMGWEYDENTQKIVNTNYATIDINGDKLPDDIIETNKTTLNFTNYFIRAREEAARLGMDSNFIEYLIPDEFGNPTMPNFMNVYASKLESVAQSLYNKNITRQTLPGWHAAQITGVGYSNNLNFDPETGIMEVYLPRWSNLIPKGKNAEEEAEILKQIQEEGLDIHLGYRIPTEGKQSIAILKVVGFTNECLGSTIIVPDEWVVQTGSDFDVDSIYGICWEMYKKRDKNGKICVYKIPYEEDTIDEDSLYIKYINNKLENKIKKTDIGEEIDSRIKEIKEELKEYKTQLNKVNIHFNTIDSKRNELFNKLPNWAKGIISDINKQYKKENRRKKVIVTDIRDVYPKINAIFGEYIKKHEQNISKDDIDNIKQYIDYQTALMDIMDEQDGIPTFNKDKYISDKKNIIQEVVDKAKKEYLQKIENAAKEARLISYKEFKKLPFVEKLDRRARNNYILDRMIKIMSDETSREEQYSRSNFEKITNGKDGANDIIDKISGKTSRNYSPYNPLDQLDYFDDVMGGARLKAKSVNWDRFISIQNQVRATLNEENTVEVILKVGEKSAEDSVIIYNEDAIKKSYPEDIINYKENKQNEITDKNVKYFSSRNEMLNAMYKDSDAFIGEVSHSPYIKQGNKFVLKNNTEVEKFVHAISKRGIPKNRINDLLSKESINNLTEEKDLTNYYNVGYKSDSKEIMAVTNRDLFDEGYTPKTIAYLRDKDRLNEPIITIQISTFKNTSTFIIDSKDTIAINYFKENGYKYIVYDSSNAKYKETITPGVGDKIKSYTLYTGAQKDNSFTEGGDSIFNEIASEYGLTTISYNSQSYDNLSIEEKQEIEDAYIKAIEKLNRPYIRINQKGGKLVRRDYLQVKHGNAIFAIGNILYNGDINSRGEQNHSKLPCVDGGTGYAVQMGINMNKPIHVYDYKKQQWYNWDYSKKDFITENTPQLTSNFTGIGTRQVKDNEKVKDAIRQLFEITKNGYNTINDINAETNTQYFDNNKCKFIARRLGYSADNRSLTGGLITTDSAQTTAHHLDAVKMGSIPNVNDYTFNTYKFLTTLGIDYETIISFIRQPIITNLVANKNITNSIFINSQNDAIKMTLADIAINLKLKNGKYDITQTSSNKNIITAIKNSNLIADAFDKLFNIDIRLLNDNEFLSIKLPLDKEKLFARIKSNVQGKGDIYENAAFDLGILLTFRNIQHTAEKINQYIFATNADTAGADPSIRKTRLMVERINKLRNDITLNKNGKSFINLIYPTINENNYIIDINSSKYKSIAAIYSYVILPSIQTNTKLFITENDIFANTENIIQNIIHHRFNDLEYKEYKQYAITTLYNQISKLLTPLTVNKRGNIIPNIQQIEQNNKELKTANQYWDIERSRIYGYGITTDGDFNINNINNPTKEDISKFNTLTPAQKVIFIQKHFPDYQGIFKYINVTLLNNTDIKYRGISRQYLSYDDQIDNIEDLFYLFTNAFANHNPIIKLAAIDLIKYAFIAEGFNFKSGYITKLITNESLYSSIDDGGLDIINECKSLIKDLPYQMRSEDFIERFVRSHSNMIPIKRLKALPEKITDKYDGTKRFKSHNQSTQFLASTRSDKLVHIDTTIDVNIIQDLINTLRLNTYVGGYIRVAFPIDDKHTNTILYKVEGRNEIIDKNGDIIAYKDFFLIPLNLLDKYETYDYSYNVNYNIFNSRDYYRAVVDKIADYADSARTNNKDLFIKRYDSAEDFKRYEEANLAVRTNANTSVPAINIPIGEYTYRKISLSDNTDGLMQLYDNADAITKGGIIKLVDGIRSHQEYTEDGFNKPYVQFNPNPMLNKLIPAGTIVEQTITMNDGTEMNVTIAHHKITNRFGTTIEKMILGQIDPAEYKEAIKDINSTQTLITRANIYRITKTKKSKKELDGIALKAATDLIIDEEDIPNDSLQQNPRKGNIDRVSSSIISEISYASRKNNTAFANRFIHELDRRHINRYSRSSLTENRENIYKSAARYYRSAANSIINKLNSFVIAGEEYSMNEPAMYEAMINHDEYFKEVSQIILDGITFGNRIADIFKLDIATEDKETKEAIEEIINSINSVRQNKKLADAMNNIINIYFKKYSTNPEIMRGVMDLRETFGDIDLIDAWIADPADIDNNEVQVIIKQIYGMFAKAELFDTRRNLKEWKDDITKIKAMTDSLDINKIIDFDNFTIKQEYNDNFLKDRQKVIDALNEAKINKDNSDADFEKYLKAKYDRDKFMYDYTEQIIIGDYYEKDLKLRKEVMNKAGNIYVKYMWLTHQLYDTNSGIEETDEETNERKRRIIGQLHQLRSETDIVGAEKSEKEKAKARALDNYIKEKRKLQEEFFDSQEYEGFQEDYKRYKDYVEAYDATHKFDSTDKKLADDIQYREAYNWIKNNGKLMFSKEQSLELRKAFKILTGRTTVISNRLISKIKNIEGVMDESGMINPMKLTDEQIAQIREEELSDLSKMYDNSYTEMILIKDVPNDTPILRAHPKKQNNDENIYNELKYKDNVTKGKIITEINKILGKTVDRFTGHIDIATLFNNDIITDEERIRLGNLYNELRSLRTESMKRYKKRKNQVYTDATNDEGFLNAMAYYNTHLKNTKQGQQFLNIFTELDSTGNLVANSYIYGYKIPNADYIDSERTTARKFINDNVDFVPTEYYYISQHKAEEQGEQAFNEWFRKNHIYNPYSHKYQPLKIWTKLEGKPGSELANSIKYIPTFDNMEKTVKEDYINTKYKEFGHNYKKGNSKYDTNIMLNKKEQALKDLLIHTLNKYATTYQGKRFVGQGYLPRERKNEATTRWAVGQLGALMGLSWHSGADSDSFHEQVDYSHDREADMKMLALIKDKGTKNYIPIPPRGTMKPEEYDKEVARIRKENRKIKEENEKIDKININKNWEEVMEHFIHNATIFNSRQAAKPYLYLLLEDLAVNNAYMIKGMWNRHLMKDKNSSTKDDTQYRTVPQERTRALVHNLARRLLFDQYHENNRPRAIANFLQNMTSAKYMIFNLYGGIANITTGKSNILAEELANEHFGFKELKTAETQYLKNVVGFIATAYSDKANTLTQALIKQFNVVDFDQILQFGAGTANLDEKLRNIRNFTYSFQSIGEHYMQNSVLLAMLKSNRLYTDNKGIKRIGDFKDFAWNIEQQAMEEVIKNDPILSTNYKVYLESIKYNLSEKLDIDTGRKDFNRNFLYSIRDNSNDATRNLYKKIAVAYRKKRDELMKKAKEEFIKNPTIESLYEFKNGEAVLNKKVIANFNKSGKNIIGDLETLIGQFKVKVEKVNQKIHGVYDKDSAAQLESKWFGSLIMQYHKHLYTGIMKRWRRKGYYSEFRGSRERGSYQTLIDFIGTEFINFNDRRKNKQQNGTNVALAAIQTTIESAINTFMNISFNYQNLSNWEQHNMKRILGDVGGMLMAALVVMALYGLYDDDDIKDDRFKSSLLYLADRLYSDSSMYSPQGLISEAKTAWSSPIASANGPSDLIKAITLIPQALFDPDYNSEYQTGQYAGKNKLEVLFRRNLPGIRPWDRIQFITRNNQYYKIEQRQIGINIAKNFGESIND